MTSIHSSDIEINFLSISCIYLGTELAVHQSKFFSAQCCENTPILTLNISKVIRGIELKNIRGITLALQRHTNYFPVYIFYKSKANNLIL